MTFWTCLIFSLILSTTVTFSQNIEVNPDSADLQNNFFAQPFQDKVEISYNFLTSDAEKNPKIALYAGIVLPGAGQLYNRQLGKLTALYIGIGSFLYLIDNNTSQYRSLKQAYENRIMGKPDQYENIINSASRLRDIRDQFRKNLELSYIGAVAFYLVGVLDGFVAAHLSSFDVTDDIAIKMNSIPNNNIASSSIGLSLSWTIQ